jgi:hypothetical protein
VCLGDPPQDEGQDEEADRPDDVHPEVVARTSGVPHEVVCPTEIVGGWENEAEDSPDSAQEGKSSEELHR